MSRVMTSFYIRWGVVLLVTSVIAFLGFQRYQKDVACLTPDQVLQNPSPNKSRVVGIIQGGSQTREDERNRAFFPLPDGTKTSFIVYRSERGQTIRIGGYGH